MKSNEKKTYPKDKKELVALIKKVTMNQTIPKHYRDLGLAGTYNSTLTGSTDAFFLLNQISKGTDDYQRIGDVIHLHSIKIKGCATLAGFLSSGAYTAVVTIFVLACKSNPQASSVNLPWTSLLCQNGAYNGWTGTIVNRTQAVNTDDFEVLYRKDVPISWFINSTSGTAATTVAAAGDLGNLFYNFDINIPFKDRRIDYEAGLNTPSAFNPFITFAITGADAAIATAYGGSISILGSTDVCFRDY
jgi:hypothetical protein